MTRLLLFVLLLTNATAQCTSGGPDALTKLVDAKLISPDRVLMHCEHVGDLQFAGDTYPVFDLIELGKNVSSVRGVQRIVILNSAWKVVKTIPYDTERPLFCRGKEIFVFGELHLPHATGGPGNVIVFRGPELDLGLRKQTWESLPSLRDQQKQGQGVTK